MNVLRHILKELYHCNSNLLRANVKMQTSITTSMPSCNSVSSYCVVLPRRAMAGHSHWANIKHGKARDDAKKGAVYSMFNKKIQAAARNGKGTNPKFNNELAAVIEASKKSSVPAYVVERALKRIENAKNSDGAEEVIEMSLLNGVKLIIHYDRSISHLAKSKIPLAFKKFGVTQERKGSMISNHFETRGVIVMQIAEEEGSDVDKLTEKYTELAIDIGAEDVQIVENEDGLMAEFTCAADDLTQVTSRLESRNLESIISEVEYKPYSPIEISKEENVRLKAICQKLLEDEAGEYGVSVIKSNIKDWDV